MCVGGAEAGHTPEYKKPSQPSMRTQWMNPSIIRLSVGVPLVGRVKECSNIILAPAKLTLK